MNFEAARQAIYQSYLNAKPFMDPNPSDRIRRRPDLLSSRLSRYPVQGNIAITGSKGKGSLARMIAALLSQLGSTGLFVSPHALYFTDRISVDGAPISEEAFCKYIETVMQELVPVENELKRGEYISPIGILSIIAMRYFSDQSTAFRVLELGRGAKYDDVNRIPHEIAVIGSIFLEHRRELGPSLREIAENKAAVITKETRRVYLMDQSPEVMEILLEQAKNSGAEVRRYGVDFVAEDDLSVSLPGEFQKKHAALAIAVASDLAKEIGEKTIDKTPLSKMYIPGRMEVLSREPFWMLDSCILPNSAREVVRFLEENGIRRITAVLCLPDDKDVCGVAKIIAPMADKIWLTKVDHPHYPMKLDQKKRLQNEGIEACVEPDASMALRKAGEGELPVVVLCANTFVGILRDLCIEMLSAK